MQLFVGMPPETLIHDLPGANPSHLDVDPDNSAIYWINNNGSHFVVLRTPISGGTTTELYAYSGAKSTMEVAVGDEYVYVFDVLANMIDRLNKTTGELTLSIPIDGTSIQFTLFEGKQIYTTNYKSK